VVIDQPIVEMDLPEIPGIVDLIKKLNGSQLLFR